MSVYTAEENLELFTENGREIMCNVIGGDPQNKTDSKYTALNTTS